VQNGYLCIKIGLSLYLSKIEKIHLVRQLLKTSLKIRNGGVGGGGGACLAWLLTPHTLLPSGCWETFLVFLERE
jgi:hypothetical protein